jgi:hypothetical protein
MGEIRFKTFTIGCNSGSWVRGSLADLLMAIPYFVPHSAQQLLPDLIHLNEILAMGIYDCGMSGGCEWKPFQIKQQEYELLETELLELVTRPSS